MSCGSASSLHAGATHEPLLQTNPALGETSAKWRAARAACTAASRSSPQIHTTAPSSWLSRTCSCVHSTSLKYNLAKRANYNAGWCHGGGSIIAPAAPQPTADGPGCRTRDCVLARIRGPWGPACALSEGSRGEAAVASSRRRLGSSFRRRRCTSARHPVSVALPSVGRCSGYRVFVETTHSAQQQYDLTLEARGRQRSPLRSSVKAQDN